MLKIYIDRKINSRPARDGTEGQRTNHIGGELVDVGFIQTFEKIALSWASSESRMAASVLIFATPSLKIKAKFLCEEQGEEDYHNLPDGQCCLLSKEKTGG